MVLGGGGTTIVVGLWDLMSFFKDAILRVLSGLGWLGGLDSYVGLLTRWLGLFIK